jgi:hypothetical protein
MKTRFLYKKRSEGLLIALIFLLFAFSIEGCKKFIEVPPPTTQLVSTNVFNNNATATSAQLAIYATMWTDAESYYMALNMGLYADELQNYSTSTTQLQLYRNSLQAAITVGPWVGYYEYIFYANSVITGLKTVSGTSPAVKNQLIGEAEFLRAFLHFYLTNIYGDVPIVLTTNPNINEKIARSPRVQVLQQVITDLQSAESLLNSNYVDGSDTIVTTERVRPNKAAALALLARAYLYMGDYSKNQSYYVKADSAASAVISNSEYTLSPLNSVFLANSSEAIWQWQTPQPNAYNFSYDGANFILIGSPESSYSQAAISPQLLNSFESGDQRLTNWIGSITVGPATYYFPYKYKNNNNNLNTGINEYTMVLRLGEQYLIRAEARAREGNTGGAESDLNMIRNRAGLPNTTATSQADLLAAILYERQVELFTEWGHRWFDLQRAVATALPVNAATVLGPTGTNLCKVKGGSWNTNNYQLLFPIPQTDILDDHNLTQNVGY